MMIEFLAWLHIPPFRYIQRERLRADYIRYAKAQLARTDAVLMTHEIKAEARTNFLRMVGLTEQDLS